MSKIQALMAFINAIKPLLTDVATAMKALAEFIKQWKADNGGNLVGAASPDEVDAAVAELTSCGLTEDEARELVA